MQNSLKIAPLEKTQVSKAVKILSKAFNVAASRVKKDVAESFSSDPQRPATFAATIDGKVAGVIRCLLYPQQPGDMPQGSVFCLAVDPAFGHQGIGHALMHYGEGYIGKELMQGQEGVICLVDETKRANPASTFYTEMGYVPEPTPRTDAEGMPILIKRVNTKPAALRK